tara:strand:- start:752 stop:889 length:138 start_codon:yes stop_codon:yes gene_type:complete
MDPLYPLASIPELVSENTDSFYTTEVSISNAALPPSKMKQKNRLS